MAKRNENECAFCAEEIEPEQAVVGQDWKVYCSRNCAEQGETLSSIEFGQMMQHVSERDWGSQRLIQT
jgi:hypothetical protein